MIVFVVLAVVLAASLYTAHKIGVSDRTFHELVVELSAGAAFICFGTIAIWLTVGTMSGQSPSFSLLPILGYGIGSALVALRAHKVYKDMYGTAPSSS